MAISYMNPDTRIAPIGRLPHDVDRMRQKGERSSKSLPSSPLSKRT
jgi:hypothetical protein